MAQERKSIDWEGIEREFRAGQLSVSEIGRTFGISHTHINRRAKKCGWARNLAERVKQAIETKLAVEGADEGSNAGSSANAQETVERAADRAIELIREHRKDIGAGRQLVSVLFDELKQASDHRDEIEQAIEAETSEDGKVNYKQRARMLSAVSLGARSTAIASLAVAMRNLVGLERQAFSLNDKAPTDAGGGVSFIIEG